MTLADVLLDAYDRIQKVVHAAVADLTPDHLNVRVEGPVGRSNSIAWLIWHLSRVQDDHLADAAGAEQVWTAAGWAERFALPFDETATGYGHSSADVEAVQVTSGELLTGYYDAVHARSLKFLAQLSEADLDS